MILGSDLLLHQLHVMNEHQTLNLVDFIILLLFFFYFILNELKLFTQELSLFILLNYP